MSTVVKSCIYNVWLHVFLFNTNKGVANPLTNHSANEHPPRIIGLSKKKYHGFCMALFSIPQTVHFRRLFLLHRKWDMLCRDGIRKRLLASCSWNLLPPLKFDIDIQNGNSDIFYKPDFGYPCEISGGTGISVPKGSVSYGNWKLGFRVGPQWFQPVEFLDHSRAVRVTRSWAGRGFFTVHNQSDHSSGPKPSTKNPHTKFFPDMVKMVFPNHGPIPFVIVLLKTHPSQHSTFEAFQKFRSFFPEST